MIMKTLLKMQLNFIQMYKNNQSEMMIWMELEEKKSIRG